MFEQALAIEYGRSNRTWSTIAGMAGQALVVAAAVVLPMAAPDALPPPQALIHIFMPTAPPAPAPPAPAAAARVPRQVRTDLQFRANVLTAPRSMPARPVLIEEPPLTALETGRYGNGIEGGIPGGIANGIAGGLAADVARSVPPPAPAAKVVEAAPLPARSAEPQRIKRGGEVQEALLIHKVVPVYPPLARQARIAGRVELSAVIGVDGRIRQLQLVRGHPLLTGAALDAVRQWVYRPTYLNGDPVEVIAPIHVIFMLN